MDKGGKNLAKMQQQQQQQQQQQNANSVPIDANLNPRPKGTDLAQLTQSSSSDKQMIDAPTTQPQQKYQVEQQQQQHASTTTNTGIKSHGKDFASMSSRNQSVPPPQQQHHHQQQQNQQQPHQFHQQNPLQQPNMMNITPSPSVIQNNMMQQPSMNRQQPQQHAQYPPPQAMGFQRQISNPMTSDAATAARNINFQMQQQNQTLNPTLAPVGVPVHGVSMGQHGPNMIDANRTIPMSNQATLLQQQMHTQQQTMLRQHVPPSASVPKERNPTSKPSRREGNLSATQPVSPTSKQPLVGLKLSTLLSSVDPTGVYSLDPEAEEQLIAMANDFANSLIKKATKVAQHRVEVSSTPRNGVKRKRVEALDVSIVLKKHYGISIPGLPVKGSKSTVEGAVNLTTARALGDTTTKSMATPLKEETSDPTSSKIEVSAGPVAVTKT
jgi:hypothetical protein